MILFQVSATRSQHCCYVLLRSSFVLLYTFAVFARCVAPLLQTLHFLMYDESKMPQQCWVSAYIYTLESIVAFVTISRVLNQAAALLLQIQSALLLLQLRDPQRATCDQHGRSVLVGLLHCCSLAKIWPHLSTCCHKSIQQYCSRY
jgi:hypothetical protein